jgi:GT2 family glycosyltransferase
MLIREKLKVAVLVINYNGKHYLKECLKSLKNQTYSDYDVYVVDNGSVDGSVEYVKGHFPWAKIIAFRENLGFAKAYNEAIKTVDADMVALLNNDTRVDKRWLQELISAMLKDELIATVGSKILLYDNPQLLNHGGAKITPMGAGFDIGLYVEDCEKFNVKKYVGAACGAAMLVRKDLFLKIKGFDEDFFAYFEDTDFCWRAWLHGFKVIYVPTAVVYHISGGSWGPRNNPNRLFLGQRNRLISMIKNLELKNLCEAIPLSLSYDVLRSLILIGRRNARGFFALVKANFWVMINLRKVMMKRRIVQSYKKIPDRYLKEKSLMATFKEAIHEYLRLSKLNFNAS